jgi:hypothetical protein
MGFPVYRILSTTKTGVFRKRQPVLLEADSSTASVGQWLEEYRDRTSDDGFEGIEIMETVAPGIEPVKNDEPHFFIERYRQVCRDARLRQQREMELFRSQFIAA